MSTKIFTTFESLTSEQLKNKISIKVRQSTKIIREYFVLDLDMNLSVREQVLRSTGFSSTIQN